MPAISTIILYGLGIKQCWRSVNCSVCMLMHSFSRFFVFSFLFLSLTLLSLDCFSQPGGEVGVSGGVAYYLGEYNPSTHFKNTGMYYGLMYRYNLNDRFAFRLNVGMTEVSVKDVKLPENNGVSYPTGFDCSVKDVMAVVEFNFRSFMMPRLDITSLWSPYLFTGVGFLAAGKEGGVTVPLGVGVKFNLVRNFGIGVEWGVRKTFTDKLDGLEDPWETGESNILFNKDWLFVTGITLSYRLPYRPDCKGYQ